MQKTPKGDRPNPLMNISDPSVRKHFEDLDAEERSHEVDPEEQERRERAPAPVSPTSGLREPPPRQAPRPPPDPNGGTKPFKF